MRRLAVLPVLSAATRLVTLFYLFNYTFKQQLIARGEATELFAREREDGFAALLGNLEQSIFGAPAYPTSESKAAHLLYSRFK